MCPAKLDRTSNSKTPQSKSSKKNPNKKDLKKKTRKPTDFDEHQEEEQIAEIDDKPKRESWLDNLPPVIKPDEELHQELTKKRRESQKQKHFEMCKKEAEAILNYAFQYMEIQNSTNKWAIPNLKADYLLGKFFTKVEEKQEVETTTKTFQFSRKTSLFNIEKLLTPKPINIKESLNSLYASINIENEYDPNKEMNHVIENLHTWMQPYTNPSPYPSPVNFPFVVCVTGPPHSGRTSISQFIHRFFNSFYINITLPIPSNNPDGEQQLVDSYEIDTENNKMTIHSTDDKYIMAKINEALQKVEPNCGLLIRNFPITKAQAGLLEKALLAYAKHKQSQNQEANNEVYLKMINCVFRTALTAEEAQNQIADRLINEKTGEIFHKKFRPPSVIDNADELIPFTLQPDETINQSSYNKILNLTGQLDILSKKGTIVIPVHLLDSTDKLELQIENALRQIYDNNNVPVPFSSFVQYRNLDQLKYSKYCNTIYNFWFDECIPQFGETLAQIFERTRVIKEKIDYLLLCAKDQLLLKLFQPDRRQIISENFIQQPPEERDYSQFFKDFWKLSIEIRDRQLETLHDLLKQCGLLKLKDSLSSNDTEIFEPLMKRFFIVEWFYKFVRSIESHSAKDETPVLPTLDFDPKDYHGIAKRIGISNSLPIIFKHPTIPEIVKVNFKNKPIFGRSYEIHTGRSISQQRKKKSLNHQFGFLSSRKENCNSALGVPNSQSNSFVKSPLHFSNSIDALKEIDKKDDDDSSEDEPSHENIPPIIQDSNIVENNSIKEMKIENQQNEKKSKEKEKITRFLNFIYDSMTIRVLRNDAGINRSIYSFLTDDIEKIDKSIDESAEVLLSEMKKWINKKYSQEMEMFSEKFRQLKKSNVIEGKLYEISFGFKEEDERDELIKKLIPYLPNNDTKIDIDGDKVIELVKLIPEEKKVISLDEILDLGKQVSFTEKELAELEITIRMETIPDFIDVTAFRNAFSGNDS